MSKIIPKEELEGYQAWQPPDMDGGEQAPQAGVLQSGAPNALTASQIEQLQREAYDEAYAAGLAEGRAAGEQQVHQRVEELDRLMQSLAQPFTELDEQVEQELVSLSIALVRQLVRREIKTDPGQIVGVVREAMAALPVASRDVRLHLHPDDAALVREAWSVSDDEPGWKIAEDPVISRGGCRVTTEDSQIDASVDTRIAQLIAQVFGARETDS